MVIENCLPEFLDQRENYWLDIIYNSSILKNSTLNNIVSSCWKGHSGK
jgi:hypothetical protein